MTTTTFDAMRENKRSAIAENVPPILERLKISPENWTRSVKHYGKCYYLAVGPLAELADYWPRLKRQWLKGKRFAEECFATQAISYSSWFLQDLVQPELGVLPRFAIFLPTPQI